MSKIKIFIALTLLTTVTSAYASESVGTINTNKYAWGENIGWVNFAPTDVGSTYTGLTITDTAITGYAWSSVHGWINFNPTNSGQGVTNTTAGVLGGSAWIANVGWLNMAGVTINSTGQFSGTAGMAGNAVGRVNFDCSNCSVNTDWRPTTAHAVVSSPSNSSGGSSGTSGSGGYVSPISSSVLGLPNNNPSITSIPTYTSNIIDAGTTIQNQNVSSSNTNKSTGTSNTNINTNTNTNTNNSVVKNETRNPIAQNNTSVNNKWTGDISTKINEVVEKVTKMFNNIGFMNVLLLVIFSLMILLGIFGLIRLFLKKIN